MYWPQLARELKVDVGQLFAGQAGDQPDWALELEERVERPEDALEFLAGALGVTNLDAAIRGAQAARLNRETPG